MNMKMVSMGSVTVVVLAIAVLVTVVGQAPAQARAEAEASTQDVVLKVSGLTCGGCAIAVKMAAKKIDGVSKAEVNLEEHTATVTYDPAKTTPDAIATTITDKTGFATEVANARDSNN